MMTKLGPVSVGEMLKEEFMKPLRLTQTALAASMGVERRLVNELRIGRRAVTVDTALMLARVFANTPEFWLSVQRRSDLWAALNTPSRRKRIARARPVKRAA
ncbi:MAG: HigA family addiction module antidote protein [Proteobacteria bacterium]|nr:HigA family addiction module antidote protein [Pseudomonadota bacterium]